jgi:hypothetical protein
MRKFHFWRVISNEWIVRRPVDETKIQGRKPLDSIRSIVAKSVDNFRSLLDVNGRLHTATTNSIREADRCDESLH